MKRRPEDHFLNRAFIAFMGDFGCPEMNLWAAWNMLIFFLIGLGFGAWIGGC